jgi:UDP-N-acetylenolpyruvoylglucosamine reductase
MSNQITSYDGGIVTCPQQLVYAETVTQIQAIMKDTVRFPGPVRAMGSFHSLTPCASCSGTIVNMSNMKRIIEIDETKMTIRAEAGLELVDASQKLRSKKLQFVTNVEIGNITLGSAACCQTKDALDHGQVDSHVIEIKWVDPTGQLREASISSDPDLLYRMRSSYGLCGIIYEVTFKLEPLEAIRLTYLPRNVANLTEKEVAEVIDNNQGVICWTLGSVAVFECRNSAPKVDLSTRWLASFRRMLWSYTVAFVSRCSQSFVPSQALRNLLLDGWFGILRTCYRVLNRIGGFTLYDPDKIVDYRRTPPSGRYAFTFWAFQRERWLHILKEYLKFREQHFRMYGFRCNMPLGSYFIRKDVNSILSYTHDGDIISIDPIHAYTKADKAAWDLFLTKFNAWAYQRKGIPLLNQSPFVNSSHVVAAYGERWHQFKDWIRSQDPNGRMLNPFFAELTM